MAAYRPLAGHVRFRNCASSFWSGSSNSVASEANAKKYESTNDAATTERKDGVSSM